MGELKLTVCKKICKECPFIVDASQGWLGPHDADEIIDSMNRDLPFSCHLQRKDDQDQNLLEMENGEQNVCRGYLACATKSAKRFGQHPYYGKEMRRLQEEITEEDEAQVMKKWDFKKYHDVEV